MDQSQFISSQLKCFFSYLYIRCDNATVEKVEAYNTSDIVKKTCQKSTIANLLEIAIAISVGITADDDMIAFANNPSVRFLVRLRKK